MARRKQRANQALLRRELQAARANVRASRALAGIAQGAAGLPRQPFGNGRRKHPPQRPSVAAMQRYFNATLPDHLPLPRPTGPYTVLRLTQFFPLDSKVVMFAPEVVRSVDGRQGWSNLIGRAAVNSALNINASNNCLALSMMSLYGMDRNSQLVPAALTVQVMNPEAVQTTTGMVWGGICGTQLPLKDEGATWDSVASEYISLMSPRVMSAAKLAFRGVIGNALPLNMSELSNFHPLTKSSGSAPVITTTWKAGSGNTPETDGQPMGLTPIMFVNPDQVGLIYQVTVEYRVRFALTNPAAAGHTQFKAGSTALWDAAVGAATALGHGIRDIAEVVAADGAIAAAAA